MPSVALHALVFAALFRRGVTLRFITWRSFVQAMDAAHFELVNGRGSTRLFVPPSQLSQATLSLIQPFWHKQISAMWHCGFKNFTA
ncbi:hypothetical protein C8Q76DRAFT_802967 [Earliella scabrosa]|nr:hypothetical protein C8Q76DRAFT_802967 [Earliella scabrosa]